MAFVVELIWEDYVSLELDIVDAFETMISTANARVEITVTLH